MLWIFPWAFVLANHAFLELSLLNPHVFILKNFVSFEKVSPHLSFNTYLPNYREIELSLGQFIKELLGERWSSRSEPLTLCLWEDIFCSQIWSHRFNAKVYHRAGKGWTDVVSTFVTKRNCMILYILTLNLKWYRSSIQVHLLAFIIENFL